MAYNKGLFKDNVPKPLGLLGLFIILLPLLMVNGVYTVNTTDMVGYLGTQSEPILLASYASMVGMIAVYPLMMRFKMYLTSRNILLLVLFGQVILNAVCAVTTATPVLMLGNFLSGGLKIMGMIELIIPFMLILSPGGDRGRFYSFFYPISIVIGQGSSWLTAWLAYNYQWQYIYFFMIPVLLVAAAVVMLIFHGERSMRKVPLYQVDWLSFVLFSTILMLINYIFVYGRVLDWFNSDSIQAAVVSLPILIIWFIKRQLGRKRPFLSFAVLKVRTLQIAMLLMILMQVLFSTGNIQSAFTSSVLKLDTLHSTTLSMWMIPGVLIGAVLSFFWFKHQVALKGLILLGFGSLVMYHVLLYFTFHPGAGAQDLYCAMVFKGLGMLLLYVSLGVLAAQNLQMLQMLMSGLFLLLFRSAIGPAIFTGLYGNMLYQKQLENSAEMVSQIDVVNPDAMLRYQSTLRGAMAQGQSADVAQSLATQSLYGNVQIQALLVTAKEIFGYVIIAGMAIMALIILLRVMPSNKRKWGNFLRPWRGLDPLPAKQA